MRTEAEIKAAFNALLDQRDASERGTAAWEMTNQRMTALAWVLQNPKVPQIVLSEQGLRFFNCLS